MEGAEKEIHAVLDDFNINGGPPTASDLFNDKACEGHDITLEVIENDREAIVKRSEVL